MTMDAQERPNSMPDHRPRVSVVCPFYNEEQIIERATLDMCERLQASFPGDFELIMVNDGSTDGSHDHLIDALQVVKLGPVRVLSYPFNQGRGRALKTGIDAARGDIIVTTEADGSWGEDIVARLVAFLDTYPAYDFVVASPHRSGGGLVQVDPRRAFLSRAGNWLIRNLFESNVTMNTGMTRAYRRSVIQPLVVFESGKEFHLEVLLKLLALNFVAGEIPAVLTWQTHRLARDPTAKRKSSTRIRRTIFTHLRFLVMAQPVRHFAVLGAATSLLSLIFLALATRNLFIGEPSGLFALVGLNLILFTLMLIGTAVTLYQVREVMIENWMKYYPKPHPPSARPLETEHAFTAD